MQVQPERSYVSGVADAPLLGMTIGDSIDQAATCWPTRDALVSPGHGVRWTWSELRERADALAAGLVARDVPRVCTATSKTEIQAHQAACR